MRPYFLAFASLALLLPASIFASENVSAGFAPGSLWLSKTQATAGDTIKIYTVVYDSTPNPVEGDVEFLVDAAPIGSSHFKLAAGESQIISLAWKAVPGTHTFTASLRNVVGADASAMAQSSVASILIAEAPPSPITKIADTASNLFASSSPAVQNIVQTIANAAEGARTSGVSWLSDALYSDQSVSSSSAPARQGKVLGAETYRPDQSAGISARAKHSVLSALLFIFSTRWLFYLSLLIVIYILYKVIQGFFRYRRPN